MSSCFSLRIVTEAEDIDFTSRQPASKTDDEYYGNSALLPRKISALMVIRPGSLSPGRAAVGLAHRGCCLR
jgi:hypothetical protein